MSWDDGIYQRSAEDDVMLPTELRDLLRDKPRDDAEQARWLLRKAALCQRISQMLFETKSQLASEALKAASVARQAAYELIEKQVGELISAERTTPAEESFFGIGPSRPPRSMSRGWAA